MKPGKNKGIVGLEWIDKFITIDQSAIGRTPRSNPATYTGIWTWIATSTAKRPKPACAATSPAVFPSTSPGGAAKIAKATA